MLKIAICDDDEQVCTAIDLMIRRYRAVQRAQVEVDIFNSAKSLMAAMKAESAYELIFLDIEMEGISGIDFGRWLRDTIHDEMTKIVYISVKEKYAMNLFKIRPLDFLRKPVQEKDVIYNIDKCVELLDRQNRFFLCPSESGVLKIPAADIRYFESSNRIVLLHGEEGTICFYDKLSNVMKKLDERYFWQIHKSYIVNVMQVSRFEHENVVMESGETLPISRSCRAEIRRRQMEMMGKER